VPVIDGSAGGGETKRLPVEDGAHRRVHDRAAVLLHGPRFSRFLSCAAPRLRGLVLTRIPICKGLRWCVGRPLLSALTDELHFADRREWESLPAAEASPKQP
jgi:hypothetical protein